MKNILYFLFLIIFIFSCSDKNDPEEFIQAAQYEYNNGNYKRAIKNINKAVKNSPNKSDCYHFRALCYMELNNYKKANKDLKKAIDIKTTHSRLNNYAYTFFKLDKYDKSINQYTKAINYNEKNNSSDHSDFFMRGSIFSLLKNYDFAVKDLTMAVQLNKNDSLTFTNRGITYYSMKEYKKAIDDFKKAYSLDKSNITSLYHLTKIYSMNDSLNTENKSIYWADNLAELIEKTDKEIIKNSRKEYTGYYELIADVHKKNNDIKNYLVYLEKAIKLSPSKKQNKNKYNYTINYLKHNNHELYNELIKK